MSGRPGDLGGTDGCRNRHPFDFAHIERCRDHHGSREQGELRSEEHTSELQSLMRISYAVFCLKKKTNTYTIHYTKRCHIHNSSTYTPPLTTLLNCEIPTS